jgi:hypothetical protein
MAARRVSGATYFFLPETGLLVTSYWGRTTPLHTRTMRESRQSDPCLPHVRAHLIDLFLLEGTTATARAEAETFRTLAKPYARTFGPIHTVILAGAPHIFGLARIFEIAASLETPPIPVHVVSTWEAAAAALPFSLEPAREEIRRRQTPPP